MTQSSPPVNASHEQRTWPETLQPSEVDFMPPLLRCLSILLRLRGKVVSAQFLLAGLAGDAKVSATACLRSAQRAGVRGTIVNREHVRNISPLALPCILLLKNENACVLTALQGESAQVIFSEAGDTPQYINVDALDREYTGQAIFASVAARTDSRVEKVGLPKGKNWFWDVLRFYMPIYRHVALASVIINLIGVVSPLFVMNVYDRVVPNHATDTLLVLAIGIGMAYAFDFLLRMLRSHFVDMAGRNADVVLSSILVDKVLTMRLDSRPESTGGLVNNLREFESLREFFSSSTLLACIDLPFLFVFLALLYFIGGPLVVLPILAIPVLFGVGIYLQHKSRQVSEEFFKQNMHKNALLVEMVNGLETVKTCMAESRMQRLWEAVVGISARTSTQTKKYNNLATTFSLFMTQMLTVCLVCWGVFRIGSGDLSMGGLIGCSILLGRSMAPLMQVSGLLSRFQGSRIALSTLDTLMTLPSENNDDKACVDFGMLEPSYTLENVNFSYPGGSKQALVQCNLHIRAGEKVGIVGRMGSGKSTLGKLFMGLYPPSEGAVRFGGVDIRQLAISDLRGRVGFLPQEVVLFFGSIRDNIALGDPSINDQLVQRAATLAGLMSFVPQLAAGFGEQVGEQGRLLSGGQRQAVALARALVRDPDVLILDEPSSNMDNASEAFIRHQLTVAVRNKTLILITHRLSMLDIVDRLIVMDNGRILHDGPKDQVLRRLRGTGKTSAAKAEQQGAAR